MQPTIRLNRRRLTAIALLVVLVAAVGIYFRGGRQPVAVAAAQQDQSNTVAEPLSSSDAASVVPSVESVARDVTVAEASTGAMVETAVPSPRVDYRLRLDQSLAETNVIQRSMMFGQTMREWVASDPEGATGYLRSMPRGNEFVSGLLLLVSRIAETDPARAVDLAVELVVNPEEMHVFNVLFDQIARKDFALAASLMSSLVSPESMDNSVRAIASRWVDADEKAALEWATKIKPKELKAPAVEAILFPMVSTDPWRALSIAARHLKGDALERTITRFLAEVTVENPGSAEDVLNFLPHGETRSHAIYGIARELAAEDPAMAIAWAEQIDEDELRRTAMRNVIEKWYAQDPEGARAFVAGSMNGSEQLAAVMRIAEFWGASDPSSAAAWAQALPGREARDAAVVYLVSGWARKDPPAGTQWALTLPVSMQSRAEAIDGALSFWALLDGVAAATYAEQLPAGENRDTCLDALASLLAVSEPDRASRLALQIQDRELRENAVRNLVDIFRYQDPARADELMKRGGL